MTFMVRGEPHFLYSWKAFRFEKTKNSMLERKSLELLALSRNCQLVADVDGLRLYFPRNTSSIENAIEYLRSDRPSEVGLIFSRLFPILLEEEIIDFVESNIFVSNENVYKLFIDEFGLAQFFPEIAPFSILINAQGNLGYSNCALKVTWYHGSQEIFVERFGAFLRRGESIFLIADKMRRTLDSVEDFNNLEKEERDSLRTALISFARIKL
jgi:hypothetical protein